MAVAPFFTETRFFEEGAISDVQDIIDAFSTEATALTNPWTEPVANQFVSEPDADGRFIDIDLTRISATNLECVLRDDAGTTIMTRRAQLVGAPVAYWLSVSQFHFWIEILNATEEAIGGGLLDLGPFGQKSHAQYTWGRGSRSAADALDALGDTHSDMFMVDDGGPAAWDRRPIAMDRNMALAAVQMGHGSSNAVWEPLTLSSSFAGTLKRAGRCYNMLFGTGSGDYTLPIGDSAETSDFRASALALDNLLRILVRK